MTLHFSPDRDEVTSVSFEIQNSQLHWVCLLHFCSDSLTKKCMMTKHSSISPSVVFFKMLRLEKEFFFTERFTVLINVPEKVFRQNSPHRKVWEILQTATGLGSDLASVYWGFWQAPASCSKSLVVQLVLYVFRQLCHWVSNLLKESKFIRKGLAWALSSFQIHLCL